MRIVSRFRDYYDGVRAIDRDDEPLYVRETNEINFADMSQRAVDGLRTTLASLWNDFVTPPAPGVEGVVRAVIGFCGRAYPVYVVDGRVSRNIDEVTAAHLDRSRRRVWHAWRDIEFSARNWERFVEVRRENVGDAAFIAMKAPVIVVSDRFVIVNPLLKSWAFAARVDPYAAWQELSVYLGNNLANALQKQPRPISDELRAHAHGFDKNSFRNTRNRPKANRSDW